MVTSAFDQKWNQSESQPIELYEFELGGTSKTLYLAANQLRDVIFGGVTYSACPIHRESVSRKVRTEDDWSTIRIGNVDQRYSEYLSTRDIRGTAVSIKAVFADLLEDSTEYHPVFRGLIDRIAVDELGISVECFSRHSFQYLGLPVRRYQQTCHWTFGDEWCGVDSETLATTASETKPYLPVRLDALTVNTDPVAPSGWSFVSDQLTQDNGHWDGGEVTFKRLGGAESIVTISRSTVRFTSEDHRVLLSVPLSITPQSGDRFSIVRGCPKTWEACAIQTDAYYPLSQALSGTLSTEPRFSGFLHLQDAQRKPVTFRAIE